MRKKKLGVETKKLFKQLLEKWEIEAEEEPEDEYCDFTSYEDHNSGITHCIWALEEFLEEHFKDWKNDE